MMILIVMAFFSLALLEIPGLIEKKYWRELAVFSLLLALGFILSLLLTLGVQFPYISTAIGNLVKKIFPFIKG